MNKNTVISMIKYRIPLILGVLFSFSLFYVVLQISVNERKADFMVASRSATTDFREHLDEGAGFIRSVSRLFSASEFVTAQEFRDFSQTQIVLHDHHVYTRALAFLSADSANNPYWDRKEEPLLCLEGVALQRRYEVSASEGLGDWLGWEALGSARTMAAIRESFQNGEARMGDFVQPMNGQSYYLVVKAVYPGGEAEGGTAKLLGIVVSLIKPAEIVQHVSELYGVNTTVRIGERIAGRGECCRMVSEALLPEFDSSDEFEYEGNRFYLSFHRALAWDNVYLKVAVLALFVGIVLSWMVQRLRLANQDKNRILFERNQLIRRQVDEQTRNLRNLNAELEQQRFAMDQHCIVSIADVAGNISYVNDQFCEISGYSRAELLGRNHRIVKSMHHPASFYEEMWHTISHGKVWHGVICNRARDGREYWVNSTIVPFLDHRRQPYQYVSIRTDVTPLKLAKESLVRQQAELNTILDNVPAMIWCKDREGRFLRVNHAAASFFGSTPEAMVGQRMEAFFPPELATHCHEAEMPVIRSGEAQLGATELYRAADGSETRFKVDRVPYHDAEGGLVGVIVMAVAMGELARPKTTD